jgi:putative MATE family efflux protein
MLSTALTQSLSIVDMGFIARLGTKSVAAVSAASTVVRILTGIGTGIAAAVLALSARFFGSGERKRLLPIAVHGSVLAALIAAVLASLFFLFAPLVISIFTSDVQVIELGAAYLRYMLAGLIFLFIYLAAAAVFQGCGNTRIPMCIISAANVLNLVLDPLLIFGLWGFPELGVSGAGLASLISHAAAALAGLCILFVVRPISGFGSGAIAPDRGLVKNIFTLAGPAAAQMITRPLSGTLLLFFVSFFGTAALAAFGIGLKLTMFCSVFMTGFMTATASLVGRFLGKGDKQKMFRAIYVSAAAGTAIFFLIALLYFIFAPALFGLFLAEEAVMEIGVRYIRILSPSLVFLGIMAAFSGTFQGAGDTPALMQTSVISNGPVKLGLAAFLGFVWPAAAAGIWFAIAFSIFIEAALLYIWFRRGGWHRKERIHWR